MRKCALFRAERALREAESNLNFFFDKRGQKWSILLINHVVRIFDGTFLTRKKVGQILLVTRVKVVKIWKSPCCEDF